MAQISVVALNPREFHAAGPPSAGSFHAGDRVWNTAPSSGVPVGWVCTVAGTPGTWSPFAVIL